MRYETHSSSSAGMAEEGLEIHTARCGRMTMIEESVEVGLEVRVEAVGRRCVRPLGLAGRTIASYLSL